MTPRSLVQRRSRRRGMALADAILGGVMLGVGVAAIMSITTRSLSAQAQGERRLVAAWLADELLSMVVVEGPEDFGRSNDTSGRFGVPFERYAYEVTLEQGGRGKPFLVTALVHWGDRATEEVRVQTFVAQRQGDEPDEPREPYEEVDRDARWFDDEES